MLNSKIEQLTSRDDITVFKSNKKLEKAFADTLKWTHKNTF
jgi:hypothetical protein